MPGTFVSSRSFTGMKPRLSSCDARPAARFSAIGVRRAARRRPAGASRRASRSPVGRAHGQADRRRRPGSTRSGVGLQQDLDAVLAQDVGHRVGHVGVLAGQQPLAALHDRHLAAEAAEHLAELQADVAAAQHEQVLRHRVQLHDRGRVQRRHAVEPRQRRRGGPRAGVDEDQLGGQSARRAVVQPHLERLRAGEARLAADQVDAAASSSMPPLAAAAEALHDVALALAHPAPCRRSSGRSRTP